MNEALAPVTPADDPAQYEATVEQYLADMDRLREQMSRDQVEIARSRARTQSMLNELSAMLRPEDQQAA
jgi:hypothetical protein